MANPEAFEVGRPHFLIFPSPNLLKSVSKHFSDCCSVESLAIIFQCSLELKQKCRFSKSSVMVIDCSLFLPLVWEASELCLWKDRQANTCLKKRQLITVCRYCSGKFEEEKPLLNLKFDFKNMHFQKYLPGE